MRANRDFIELRKLQIENRILREKIDLALKDLSDDECNLSIRNMSAKFTLAGADAEAQKEVEKYLESIKKRIPLSAIRRDPK